MEIGAIIDECVNEEVDIDEDGTTGRLFIHYGARVAPLRSANAQIAACSATFRLKRVINNPLGPACIRDYDHGR